ncbi:hypothetical protein ACVWZK_006898 [Bradyrhizobium sp. GM0.4]
MARERHQPTLLGPDRHLVGADGEDVELAALGGDVGCDALAQHVLFQRHPFDADIGVLLGEFTRQPLHADHVAVVHGGNRQGRFGHRGDSQQDRRATDGAEDVFHGDLPKLALLSICPRVGRMFG